MVEPNRCSSGCKEYQNAIANGIRIGKIDLVSFTRIQLNRERLIGPTILKTTQYDIESYGRHFSISTGISFSKYKSPRR